MEHRAAASAYAQAIRQDSLMPAASGLLYLLDRGCVLVLEDQMPGDRFSYKCRSWCGIRGSAKAFGSSTAVGTEAKGHQLQHKTWVWLVGKEVCGYVMTGAELIGKMMRGRF